MGESGSWAIFYHYFLIFYLRLVLHEALEVDCGGADWFFLAFPELTSEVLSLQQIFMPLQVLRIDIARSPIHKLHLFSHPFDQFLSLLHKLHHLLLILQLHKLLPSLALIHLILHLNCSRWRVIEMREG